jgi:hypothetical protein
MSEILVCIIAFLILLGGMASGYMPLANFANEYGSLPLPRNSASGVCKASLVMPAKSCHMELRELQGWKAVRDQTPFTR